MQQLNGKVHFEKFGDSGQVVVLLHGWGHSLENLRGLAEILAWRHTVYAFDLPGFGDSALPPETWGTADYADCVAHSLQQAGVFAATFVGHSFGGRVGIQLAARKPELVQKLVLLNSSGLPPVRPWQKQVRVFLLKYLARLLKQIDTIAGTRLFMDRFVPRFASKDYKSAGSLRSVFVRTVNEDLTQQARAISQPTLLLWGERDTETPIGLGRKLQALIRGSRMCVLEGKGHEPFADVGAHLCAYHLFPFIDETAV